MQLLWSEAKTNRRLLIAVTLIAMAGVEMDGGVIDITTTIPLRIITIALAIAIITIMTLITTIEEADFILDSVSRL